MKRIALVMVLASLTGCAEAVSQQVKNEAISYCKEYDGYLEFHHAGKYDTGDVIGITCHHRNGSKYFDRPSVRGATCFNKGGSPEWVHPDEFGRCPPPESKVGNNQLGIKKATP